jgi:voltage-gated potassium channel
MALDHPNFAQRVSFYLEDFSNPLGKAINISIFSLVLISFGIFVLQTYDLGAHWAFTCNLADQIILGIFTIEYLLRLWAAPSKTKFLVHPLAIVDLLALAPLLMGLWDAELLRVLRWIRILRVFRFLDLELFLLPVKTKDGIVLARILIIVFAIIFLYSGIIYQLEHEYNPESFKDFFDAFYFAVVTMTTVGFGDMIPLSPGGKLITVVMILTGIMVIPWQVGEFVRQLLKTINKVNLACGECGLTSHDQDARFCKVCGQKLTTSIALKK